MVVVVYKKLKNNDHKNLKGGGVVRKLYPLKVIMELSLYNFSSFAIGISMQIHSKYHL